VAESVEAFYAAETGTLSVSDALLRDLLPVFAGNSLGGVTFAALLNFGQVAGDGGPRERERRNAQPS
jgi:formate/nitrite transporter FocA (FNT family)